MRAVATIPAGVTLDVALAAMKGLGDCYPPETLSLSNDPSGGMLVLYAERTGDAEPEPAPRMVIGVGDEPGHLLAFAFTAAEGDEQDGLKAMALGMIRMLENAGASNYLSLTIEIPDVGRYGVNIQRCDGKTPAERIAELEAQIVQDATAAAPKPSAVCVDCDVEFTPVDPDDEICVECIADMTRQCPRCGRIGVHTCKGSSVTDSSTRKDI